ncbi:hypothetical protein VOLCADRAFT_121361 [Volvox carteri f. nagariensis]|uniref:Uncharacterized protein n=1 Tax=Volvox carteri f. nagariensis TaxID=3068 RepID=D8U8D8_VOLCA|nr:uncharacterized protein VOLCADRAFT_121361 [Volvox carteri f. nagariensis]EFJ43959.1 hypothetical protein VOLCADRAFT_121361 [Volvox carteri f. nagariensis]|eukprot:XP_002954971.1 hypothetical protein VOLCADRAFT_121361 [Volvox carteri f. nagariensis]
MARPQSSKNNSKQRGPPGSGKRKHGAATTGGGSGGRPAKQSRREGKPKPTDRDVYEAEDSDPDEVKHAERFDKVDNYEYELPSDFEDEEIDEELAFTEEDKKKFGGWFEKEVSADEDDDGALLGDGNGEDWDDEGEGEDDDDEEDEDRTGVKQGGGRAQGRGIQEDDDDDLFLGDDDDDDDEDGDMNGSEDDEEGDEGDERHRAMLRDVLGATAAAGSGGARKRARRDANAAVVSEAYPESEYNLNPGAASAGGAAAGTLSVADLLKGLTAGERRKLGAARRLLEKVAAAGGGGQAEAAAGGSKGLRPVPVPLPAVVAERQERKAGYEAAAEDVTKWQSIVKANREAPTLRLVSGRGEVPRVTTTAALVAALLEAAGVANTKAIEEAEEKLALKALSLEEAKERRERLAKMRSLLFYHELKARRLKSIKSKEYHRHLARAAKRKAAKLAAAAADAGSGEGGAPGSADAERVAAIEAEYQRAKERLTQRHRNSSRWARRVLKRGQLQLDAGTKAALAEQLQLGQQLKRKIEGRKDGDGSGDSDASTSASDSDNNNDDGDDGDAGRGGGGAGGRSRQSSKVRSAALELLAGGGALELEGDNAPKKGILALPFMKRAMERRRQQAQQDAEQLLRELDEQQDLAMQEGADVEDGGGRAAGQDGKADPPSGFLESLVGYSVPRTMVSGHAGGRRKFGGGNAAAAAAAAAAADAAEAKGDGSDLDSDDAEDAEAKAERLCQPTKASAAAAAAAAKQQQQQQKGSSRGKVGKAQATAAPPTAADEADLDAAIAAGAAGRGLLATSSDLGVDLTVVRDTTQPSVEDAEVGERRESGRRASTRAAAAAAGNAGGNKSGTGKGAGGGGLGDVLKEVGAQQASLAPGGGRAALFEAATGKRAAGDGGDAAAAAAKFLPAKKFDGARAGYAFKKGPQGLGYYSDVKDAAAAGVVGATTPAGGGGGGKKGRGKQQQQQQCKTAEVVVVAGQPTRQQQPRHGEGQPPNQQSGDLKDGQKQQKQQPQQGQEKKQQQQQQASKGVIITAANGQDEAKAATHGGGRGDQEDDDDDAPMMRPADQRDLIRQAFAGDDVEEEFAAEKASAVAEELPHVDEPSGMPGWGAWASQQRNPKWMQAAKEKAAKIRADAAAGRKDANLKYVVISEKWDKKASKYMAPAAPFPFTNQEAYERSLRQPLGREYNPDAAFRDLTRPAPLAKELGRSGNKAVAKREAKRVVTVAGGMPRQGKR